MVTPGPEKGPVFDGRGSLFLDVEQQVYLWMRTTKQGLAGRSSLLVLHMRPAPRQVCPTAGGGFLGIQDGVARILEALGGFFAPRAAGAIHQ